MLNRDLLRYTCTFVDTLDDDDEVLWALAEQVCLLCYIHAIC